MIFKNFLAKIGLSRILIWLFFILHVFMADNVKLYKARPKKMSKGYGGAACVTNLNQNKKTTKHIKT